MSRFTMIMFAGLIAGTAATGCGDTINNIPSPSVPAHEAEKDDPIVCIHATDGKEELNGAEFLVTKQENGLVTPIPMVGNCVSITDLTVDYVVIPFDIDGYVTPRTNKVILAGSLRKGDVRQITFVYRSSVAERCVVTTDQFGNQVAGPMTLNGVRELGLNERQRPTGRWCGEIKSTDEIYFGTIPGYTGPQQRTLQGSGLMGAVTEVQYDKPGASNLCFTLYTSNGDLVQRESMWVDGIEVSGGCTAVDSSREHRVNFPHISSHQYLPIYYVKPSAMRPGETRMIERRFVPAANNRQICVQSIPGDAGSEVKVRNQSIGWQLSETELPCEIVYGEVSERDVQVEASANYQPVAVHTVIEDQNQGVKAIALHNANRRALVCAKGVAPWGGNVDTEIWIATATIASRWNTPACASIDPSVRNVIRFGTVRYQNNLGRPDPITIEANEVQPGAYRLVEGQYREISPQHEPEPEPQDVYIDVVGPQMQYQAGQVRASLGVPVRTTDQRGFINDSSNSSKVRFTLYRRGDSVTVEFRDTQGLRPITRSQTFMFGSLPQANYNAANRRYEFTVEYTTQTNTNVALICVDITDQNDMQITPGIEVDGRQPQGNWNQLPCSYVTTAELHQVWTWRPAGYGYGYPIIIPPNQLQANILRVLRRQMVLETRLTIVCVETSPVVAQIDVHAMDRNEVVHTGWSDVFSANTRDSCFPIDTTRPYGVLATAIRNGRPVTLTPVTIAAGQHQQGRSYTLEFLFP